MKIQAGKEYRSRRGERVLVTAVEEASPWPVHFIVMDGRYKGVGKRDGSRLTIDGRALAPDAGARKNHWNDLIAAWTAGGDSGQTLVRSSQFKSDGEGIRRGRNPAARQSRCSR